MQQPDIDTLPPLEQDLTESVAEVKAREAEALTKALRQTGDRCVIFGSGTLGKKAVALLREIGVDPLAMCDSNSSRWGTAHDGLTILSPAEAAKQFGDNAVFFVTIWNDFHWFRDTLAKMTALGCRYVSSYAPLFWRFGDRFMDLLLLNEPAHRLYEQKARVLQAEHLWGDEESLQTYRANILWRAKGDPSRLPFPAPRNTYFPEDLFSLVPRESLVDCGAFDGDTIRAVAALAGENFEAIHAIEADTVSLEKLRSYLAAQTSAFAGKVHILPCAVGAEKGVLRFVMCGAATSKSSEEDGVLVDCIPLDELFAADEVTFIKMDIEGAEFDAVRGGLGIIERDLPILAICVYHTQSDIWRIPLLIHSRQLGYKLYLRSYDGDGFQTVMYAVPPARASTIPSHRPSTF